MSTFRELTFYFNLFCINYTFLLNSIYLLQLIISSIKISGYMKKIRYSDYKKYASSDNMIPISILVPAYNEEETIVDSINSLLSLNYQEYEVIIINDGSLDLTLTAIINQFKLHKVNQPIKYNIKTKEVKGIYRSLEIPNLLLVDKENGGKADALNVGINVSRYPVFASIDADSILESESLVRLIMPFVEDFRTVAVGGIVRIANGSFFKDGKLTEIKLPQNIFAIFQIIEYLRAFLAGRMGWDALGTLLIISGAFGAFRKKEVIEIGGYTVGTIGEDMDLIVKIHRYLSGKKAKYKIKFIPDPVCWTQAPETFRDLRSQRIRWQVGLIDSLLRNKTMLFNMKYGRIGLLAIPYFWVFELLGPFVEFLGYILVPASALLGILHFKYFFLFLIVSVMYGTILSLGAVLMEEYTFNRYSSLKDLLILTVFALLDNFGYRQMNTLFRIEGLIYYRKNKEKWGKIKRRSFTEMTKGKMSA